MDGWTAVEPRVRQNQPVLKPRRVLRRLPALVAGIAMLLAVSVVAPPPVAAGPDVLRLAGADRYATAVAVSRASHPSGAPVAVLTTGATFPDALAGGPAAAALGGPVLLVQRDQVPTVVVDELRRLHPEQVLLLGGTSAVSDTATAQLRGESYSVERVAGAGRYDTAALVSQRVFPPGAPVVYVATGADYPDALAGAASAARSHAPVLLVARDSLPAATATELTRLSPQRIVLLGGPGAVSTDVEQALRSYAPSVTRLGGVDRYATAAAVARATPGTPGAVFLATGQGFADALSGGPAAAQANAPVLLAPQTCIPAPVHTELERDGYPPVTLLGGEAALTPAVADLMPCLRVPDGQLATGVTLSTMSDPSGPWTGKVIEVAPSAVWRLETVLAQDSLPGLETTSSMARRTNALVAINGDFALPGGRPVHAFAREGRLVQTPQSLGRNVAVDTRSGQPHLGFPSLDVQLTVDATRQHGAISKINSGASGGDSLALTTPEGTGAASVPGSSCAGRLRANGTPSLLPDGRMAQGYSVAEVACGSTPLSAGGDVVTAPLGGTFAPLLQDLSPGDTVTVSWSVGWPGVLDTVGGNPTLMESGTIMAGNVDGTDAFSRRNPRTAVGYRADGTILLVTIDGRESDGSAGMTLRELAELFRRLGATDALNLDGGGSTTMVIGREVQNNPSDGRERPVSSALVLDSDSATSSATPSGGLRRSTAVEAPVDRPQRLSPQQEQQAEDLMTADPGSAGGFQEHSRAIRRAVS